jgi:cytochrome c oxidase assembly factor CtaG
MLIDISRVGVTFAKIIFLEIFGIALVIISAIMIDNFFK